MIRVAAGEARKRLSDLLGRVYYGREIVIIEQEGRPMVAVVPIDLLERWMQEREAAFRALEDWRNRLPDVPPEEVLQDVQEALKAVRASDASGGA